MTPARGSNCTIYCSRVALGFDSYGSTNSVVSKFATLRNSSVPHTRSLHVGNCVILANCLANLSFTSVFPVSNQMSGRIGRPASI